MDFYQIKLTEPKKKDEVPQLYPDWKVGRTKDLMVRGRSFYAVWDEAQNLWSRDEYDVQRLVDEDLHRYRDEEAAKNGFRYGVKNLQSFNTNVWTTFRKYMANISDNSHPLDESLTFANTVVQKSDYVSRRLPYSLEPGTHDAWDELVGVLYNEEERAKIEWAIGAVVSGDSKKIQKFLVFYGPPASGKGTVINIIQMLFPGYYTTFDAKALGRGGDSFATEVFASNPLVAIQHDGDLSRIEDNTRLNQIVSHEEMPMNAKFKAIITERVNAFLFMGTNTPVKISDAKSGIIRRLIDVHPTGVKIDPDRYHVLMSQVGMELGAIAEHCLQVYKKMGKNYYGAYRPLEMMLQTDVFYNFVECYYDVFKRQNGSTLKQAYELYKTFCADTGINDKYILPQFKFREELRNYFEKFDDRVTIKGETLRSYYSGFKDLPTSYSTIEETKTFDLGLVEGNTSTFDRVCADQPAQYGKESGHPGKKWALITDTLSSLETSRLHYVKIPKNHIVIDFDLVDEDGNKSLERNIAAASEWPSTYAETSQSGAGLHLHYYYSGDVSLLSNVYDVGIEVKTLLGDASLRRRLTKCNNREIATLSSGLPLKEKPMLTNKSIQSEKGLRDLIERNLRKEINPGTKSSVDFIHAILEEAYENGLSYDVRDMRGRILSFASGSTNQSLQAVRTVQKMRFVSKEVMETEDDKTEAPIAFYDVEVYPNLFVVCWKYAGDANTVRMINPEPREMEALFAMKLIGFNNRRYDNHILYARFLGYSLEEVYKLSKKIIDGNENTLFGEAYNISYADIYDFSSKKQGLKKFQIELGLKHMEMDLPWDQPVPEELWGSVVDYCVNDVESTEVVFESRREDFVARQILSELSGLSVNHTTANHTAKIIFGDEKYPQSSFVYTDLSEEFPGYTFDGKDSMYRGEVTGEGGYVYAEPGVYENVALLDVASMHPTTIEILNMFGPYTGRYSELKEARLAIKHKDYDKARTLLGGKLAKFLGEGSDANALSYALKIVINIVYGLTSTRYPQIFKDNRNTDNIVAKRGALFMIDLKHAVQERGYTVAHIKTDSIKIPDAKPDIIQFVMDFGKKYGYDFEHEGTYDKFCLVNDAVYIAAEKVGVRPESEGEAPIYKWTAVGAQFQHPYVFKTLFTHEPLVFEDYCETKNVVQGVIYLDFNVDPLRKVTEFVHVGRTGSFVPVLSNGGTLWRIKDDKKYAVTGTKGYRWIERDIAINRPNLDIDMSYFENLRIDAKEAIEFYGDFDRFVS